MLRLIGLPEDRIQIDGLALPLRAPFEVSVPVSGLRLDEPLPVGEVTFVAGGPAVQSVEEMLNSRQLRAQSWQRWRVKDGEKGPMVWEVKHARFHPKDESGLPGAPLHLLVARAVLNPEEIKFFVSNAPAETPVATVLLD